MNFLVSSYDDEEFNVVPKEKRIVSQSGKITLWDDTTLQFIDYGTQSAALLTIDKTKVLFCFCPAVKIAELPPEWYMADALVCRQAVPRDAPDYTLTVVTGDSKISLYKNELNKRGALLATAGGGSVEILTKGNHSVSAGRNNNGARWRKGIKTTNKIKELF